MEVILLEAIQNLGGLGERAHVKPGYARNFLVPKGKALLATEANLKIFEERRTELEKAQADELAAAKARAREIEGVSLRFERKVGGGRLFGSVTAPDVVEALSEQGVAVSRSEIRLPEGPLRNTGRFEIEVHVHPQVNATVRVAVVSEDSNKYSKKSQPVGGTRHWIIRVVSDVSFAPLRCRGSWRW